jgi:uncharacterized protein YtpQ (UPF0354 family)
MIEVYRTRLRHAWLCSLVGLVITCPMAAAAPAEADFTKDMLTRINKLAPNVMLVVTEPLSVRVLEGPQAGSQINFDRINAFCEKNDAALCEEQKDSFATAIAASFVEMDYSVTRERLRVVVRSEEYVAKANSELVTGTSGPLVIVPLIAGLDLVLAADFPETTRLVSEGDLKALGLTPKQAIALGTEQVLAALPPLPEAKSLASTVIMIPGQDYGASYLLATDKWQSLAKDVKGVLWVAVPADDKVVVGVARNENELSKLKPVVAEDYATAARGISPLIFRWTERGWQPLK